MGCVYVGMVWVACVVFYYLILLGVLLECDGVAGP